jgi:hypothetical protein
VAFLAGVHRYAFLLERPIALAVKRSRKERGFRIRLDRSILDRDIDVAFLIAAATIAKGGSMDLIERLETRKFELVRSAVDDAVRIVESEFLKGIRYEELTEEERERFYIGVASPDARPFLLKGRLPSPEALEAFLRDASSDPTVASRVAEYASWIVSKVMGEG